MESGKISVQSENIFPIIKKFLYSDHEIFLRELVSNAVDATQKLKALSSRGEASGELGDLTIQVRIDRDARTITIHDRGIGMSEEEVKKYLNQVAFSSAQEFLDKYKDETNIIGHFGLGFYSAFMVADKVEVVTKSFREEEAAVRWTCAGDPSYTMAPADKTDRGTEIILYLSADSDEFLEDSRIEGLLRKYCRFLPVPIQFGTRKETQYEGEGEDEKAIETEVPNIVNNPNPSWKKPPTELTDEDYLNFYQELHPYSAPPMFWIHLNIEYPFNLTGILYFPKLGNNFELQRNKIQLYANQVYVTDDVKEIVPEFLTLLHGVIDSPDIPLNVSRSYLQSDRQVKQITGYITRKVAEKLADLSKADPTAFAEKWSDLGVFVKYGMISDEKFYERAAKFALLKNTAGDHFTLEAYRDKVKDNQTDKYDRVVYMYTHDPDTHHHAVEAAQARGYDVLIFDHVIDNHFLQHLEHKEDKVTFVRVDSDTVNNLVQKDEQPESVLSEAQVGEVKAAFENVVKDGGRIETKALTPDDQPVLITRPEFMRRLQEMQALQGNQFGDLPVSYNVVVNTNHPLIVNKLLDTAADERPALATHLYQLALLSQNLLKGPELTAFVKRTLEMVGK